MPKTTYAIRETGLKDLTPINKNGKERVISANVRTRMIVKTETAEAYTIASLQSYYDNGVTNYSIQTVENGSICKNCLNTAFEANSHIESMQDIKDNDYDKQKHPLILAIDIVITNTPPIHPNAYSKDISIYTKEELETFF